MVLAASLTMARAPWLWSFWTLPYIVRRKFEPARYWIAVTIYMLALVLLLASAALLNAHNSN
jgi:hypothetical protein